jgi:hypothetical protein
VSSTSKQRKREPPLASSLLLDAPLLQSPTLPRALLPGATVLLVLER